MWHTTAERYPSSTGAFGIFRLRMHSIQLVSSVAAQDALIQSIATVAEGGLEVTTMSFGKSTVTAIVSAANTPRPARKSRRETMIALVISPKVVSRRPGRGEEPEKASYRIGARISFCTRQFNNSPTKSSFSDGHAIS